MRSPLADSMHSALTPTSAGRRSGYLYRLLLRASCRGRPSSPSSSSSNIDGLLLLLRVGSAGRPPSSTRGLGLPAAPTLLAVSGSDGPRTSVPPATTLQVGVPCGDGGAALMRCASCGAMLAVYLNCHLVSGGRSKTAVGLLSSTRGGRLAHYVAVRGGARCGPVPIQYEGGAKRVAIALAQR